MSLSRQRLYKHRHRHRERDTFALRSKMFRWVTGWPSDASVDTGEEAFEVCERQVRYYCLPLASLAAHIHLQLTHTRTFTDLMNSHSHFSLAPNYRIHFLLVMKEPSERQLTVKLP